MANYLDKTGLQYFWNKIKAKFVIKSGDTMTGKLTLKSGQYSDAYNSGALDLKNSNIDGVNSIFTADKAESAQEGIQFYRDTTHVDSLHATNGVLYFTPNRQLGTNGTSYPVITSGSGQTFPEAYLSWGGRNFSASYGCIDAAMIGELGANRFAFLKPVGIEIEYSTDGGSSWIDYGATDTAKTGLFGNGVNHHLGKATTKEANTVNNQLRVTITTNLAQIYTNLNKIAIFMNTAGNTVQVKIEKARHDDITTYITHLDWTNIAGWSGWNILNINGLTTYGNSNSQYQKVRFIFKQTAVNTNYASAQIIRIMGFGGVGWTAPSNMAKNGHLYAYDNSQNATFPANVTAPKFIGALQGNADTATNATKVNNHTVNADVPSGAKFTDTTYDVASSTTAGLVKLSFIESDDFLSGYANIEGNASGHIALLDDYDQIYPNNLPDATSGLKGAVKVDTALSSSSANPVQNKAINTALTNLLNMIQYKSGDSFVIGQQVCAGQLTSSGRNIYFTITCPKQIPSGLSVSLSGTVNIRHPEGNLVAGQEINSIGTLSTPNISGNMIYVQINLDTASSLTNNRPLTVQLGAGFTISFS